MEKHLYRSLAFVLLIAAIHSSLLARPIPVSIVSSNDQSLHFSVRIEPASLEREVVSDSTVSYFKTVTVGVPPGAAVSILSAEGSGSMVFTPTSDYTVREPVGGHLLASISKSFLVRGRQLVNVRLYPVAGNQMFSEIEISLSFDGSGGQVLTGMPARDRFDRIFKSIVVNYEQFRTWPTEGRSPAMATAAAAAHPFSITTQWYKLFVGSSGLYRVTGSELSQAGLSLSGLSSSAIHLFNGGGLPLPVDNDVAPPELSEVAITVNDGGDGRFDSGDELIFYGESVNRWLHETVDTFVNNAYTSLNVYWLSVSPGLGSGLRMQSATAGSSPQQILTTYRRFVHLEQDSTLLRFDNGKIEDYFRWYWTAEPNNRFFVPAPGLKVGDTVNLFLTGKTSGTGTQTRYMDLRVNGVSAFNKFCGLTSCRFQSLALRDALNSIDLTLYGVTSGSNSVPGYFDYLDIEYTANLVPSDNKLDITLAKGSGTVELRILDNLTASPFILDLADPLRPTIVSFNRSGGFITFNADLQPAGTNHFYLGTVGGAESPVGVEKADVVDLRSNLSATDALLVTTREFASELTEYISYRNSKGDRIRLATVEDIMDNFSSGLYDPTAIRDYLKYNYENSIPAPVYALFVGDGTYDFLDLLATGVTNKVPPYVHPFDFKYFYSDDNYVYFGRYGILDVDTSYDTSAASFDRGYDMITSRWPVRNSGEIAVVIDKIKRYEAAENLGPWRSRITFVADDEVAGASWNEPIHVRQSDSLARAHVPQAFQRNKIYLWEHPLRNGKKPEVNDAIVKAINDGTLLINYVGHGNPDLWAHEHVFTRTDDLPRLDNIDRLSLVFTASCEIAQFDNPKREGMAEDLLVIPQGGAVSIISATRRVYSGPNADLNKAVFDDLLFNKSLTICEALYTAKIRRQYGSSPVPQPLSNDQAYIYFGDPFLKLGIPQHDIVFTQSPSSLQALLPVTVKGSVLDNDSIPVLRDGRLFINVFDSERQKQHNIINPATGNIVSTESYAVTGPSIFRGSATITGGDFEFSFIPPLDIGYNGTGAKISVYAQFDDADGMGLIGSLAISDSIAVSSDSIGPIISFGIVGRNDFISGGYISKDDQLDIRITDPSGINLTGALGHGITLEVDGRSEETVNLVDLFEYDQDEFTTGHLTYALDFLETGEHQLKIKAWDNANNASSIRFSAEVLASNKMAIRDLLNYPNPMRDSTRISYFLTQPVREFIVEIFTLSGRKIRSFINRQPKVPGYYDDIIWYGEDQDFDRVATGVYIYKATAFGAVAEEVVESFGKIILIN